MRTSRFAEEQIFGILGEADGTVNAGELSWRHGISRKPLCRWKRKPGGPEVGDAQEASGARGRNPPVEAGGQTRR